MLFSKKLKYSILLALFCIVPFFLFAQKTNEELAKHLSKIKIDELVIGTLSEVLDRFEKRYEIPFSFDRKALNKIKINERPFEARFDTYLETTLSEHRLKYVLYEAKIYVIPKSNTLEQVMRKEAVRNTHNKDTNNKAITEQIFKNVVPKKFNFTITGRVKDAETGETLPFSTIMIKGTTQGVTANADGYFILQNVPTDTSTIVGQYMGYKDLTIRLLPHLSNENIVLDLMPSSAIDEVIIEGERENLMQSNPQDISVIRLTPRSLERLPNVGEKDIMRSFQLMPGVSASNESSSGLYVRGGTPDQNLIVYDGFTVYHVDHLYGFFSAFNSNALKDVQLHKGGFDSRFGGRLASVTEITGKDGNQKQFNMGGDVSLLSMNVFAELPIGDKFTSVFAYRRSYKGFLYNSIMDKFNQNSSSSTSNQAQPTSLPNTNQTKATSYFYDLNGKMTYRFSDNHSLAWSIYNGTDKLDNGYKIETPSFLASQGTNLDFSIGDLTRYGNVGTSLKWTQRWSPKFYGNVLLSYSNYYSNRDRTNNSTITLSSGETRKINFGTIEDNNLKDYSLKADYQYDIHPKHQLQFGAMLTNYDIKYSYSQNDTTTIISKDDQGKTYSFYLQNRMKFLDNKLQIIAGARTTYFDVTAQNYIEPRLNATYQLNKKITLKGAWGKYYQFANRVLREDILAGSRDFWVLSNGKNIPVSSSMHYIAGVSYDTRDYLLSVEGYYKSLEGLSEYSLRFDGGGLNGVKYTENFFNGKGYSQGIELLAQKKGGKFNGWVSYTLGQVKHQFDVYGKNYFSAGNDVTHEFKAVGIYQWKRFDFSMTWIYATGRPYTAPSGGYNIQLLDGESQSYFSVSDKNALRLPDYHRLDIAANYRLQNSEGGDIGYIGLSFFNVYNRTNTWYKQFQIIENNITSTNINYFGFLPNVTLSLKMR